MTKFQYEEDILKFWKENKIQKKVDDKNKGSKLFNVIDGPPFPTGEPHVGHVRNWSIKDTVLRFKRSQGYEVYARDGYDVHGLPVENKVQAKLNLKTIDELKEFGEDNFIKECRKYVNEVINSMGERRERYGLSMDRNYYHTSHPEYISLAWKFFEIANKKGLLYKDYKTVAWCPHDQTTLSDYEIKDEYTTIVDPSIYVAFEIANPTSKYKESLLIWTTTPWTLQSNMAIAVNPAFNYAKALVQRNGKEEVLIIGESLVEQVIEKLSKSQDIKLIKVLETFKGAELEGVKYNHIYLDETPSQQEFVKDNKHKHIHSVILADYVTLDEGEDILEKLEKKGNYKHSNATPETKEEVKKEDTGAKDGTGLVHIAPGHGQDDYVAAQKYNIPTFCPVGPDGCFTEGKYDGKYFKDVNPIAVDYLKEKDVLLHSEDKSHRYPCCWRCKTPICYRAADQWFIKRSEVLDDIQKQNQNVQWYPNFAKSVFDNITKTAGDWAISRQRYWGIPLPIFEDGEGNYKVFGSKEELEKEVGHKLEDVHKDNLKDLEITLDNGNKAKAVPFTTDVWFESGCASFASHYGEGLSFDEIIEKYYPIKWITEGQDQIRGWFSSLFHVGHILTGKAPYNQVLYQQFIMAKDGTKMSKSLGNGIDGNEAIEKFGADATRYYLLTKRAPEDQINFNEEEFNLVYGFFNTLENVVKFVSSYLKEHEMNGVNSPSLANLSVEDKWVLSRLNNTIESFTHNFENYKLHIAFSEVEEFLTKDFSKTYLKLVKERTSERDENLIYVLNEVLKKTLIMFSSAIPFKAEEQYQIASVFDKKESIFLEEMPAFDQTLIKKVKEEKIEDNFEVAQDIVAAVLNSREKVKIGVRWPLSEINIISSNKALGKELEVFEKLIKDLTNINKISYDLEDIELNYNVKPNFASLKQDFKNPSDAIKVINSNKSEISADIKEGLSQKDFNGVSIDFEKHLIKEIVLSDDLISSDFNGGSIILHTIQDDTLLEQGFLREAIRRIQDLRKENGLNKNDEITLSFEGSDDYFTQISKTWEGVIKGKVGAKEIVVESFSNKQEFTIKDKKLVVGFKK